MTPTTPAPAPDLSLEQAIGQTLLLAFPGRTPAPEILANFAREPLAGVTLFRSANIESPAQVRALCATLQTAATAAGLPPLLIGADQEGGTLLALAGATRFPGAMALGAADSPDLARQVGFAMGRELAAMGVNIDYAPVCDVNVNPANPVVGVRSFGADPARVGALAAAMISGLQAAGVAATAKHFPGHGDTATDSHFSLATVPHDAARLRQVELPPFAAAIAAGVRLVMTAHLALPALTGAPDLPATLAPAILRGLLREEMGFAGVIISDAMDMRAIDQGPALPIEAIAAATAGVDLLLMGSVLADHAAVRGALLQAARRGLLDPAALRASAGRVLALKRWLAGREQPPLDVVACAEHEALAYTVAARALTLVRDQTSILPLRLAPTARVLALAPRTANLTLADTSSFDTLALGSALRRRHPAVDEILYPADPTAADVAALVEQARGYDAVVIATIEATRQRGQAALVGALVAAGAPVVAVALRLPYDLAAYPTAPTFVCTYSHQPAALDALADGLWGQIPFAGRLPVTIPEPA
jgi:beta-N-acetylhexosaminidase